MTFEGNESYEDMNGYRTSPNRERTENLNFGAMATLIEIESYFAPVKVIKDTRTEAEKMKHKPKSLGNKPSMVGEKLVWRQNAD